MKNLLKKTFSLLIALTMLLVSIPSFADEAEKAVIPTFEVGKGMSGTLRADPATEIKAHAGKRGRVKFTLTLTEDCGFSITVDGGGVALSRQSEDLPVYTFISRFEWNQNRILCMTAQRETGYTVTSEFLPEEPAQEEKPAEAPVSAPEPENEPESEPASNPEPQAASDPEPEQAPEPEAAPDPEPEPEAVADPEPEAVPAETAGEPAEPVPAAETEQTETTEPENQPAQPEEKPEEPRTAENAGDDLTAGTMEEPVPETTEEGTEPAQETDENEPAEEGKTEGSSEGKEIIIVKTLTPEESWSGTVRRKPSILKLDVAQTQSIHIFVQGKNVCYSVQKSDRITEDAGQILTDTATNRSITSLTAEAGSYLISIQAGENSLAAKVTVTFMNDEEFEAWEDEQMPPEPGMDAENEGEEENRPESDNAAGRHINVHVTWDLPDPVIGDTAHFKAELEGYDGLDYTLQWQYSPDKETWYDITGETNDKMDVVVTEENNDVYWRILVYVEEEQET